MMIGQSEKVLFFDDEEESDQDERFHWKVYSPNRKTHTDETLSQEFEGAVDDDQTQSQEYSPMISADEGYSNDQTEISQQEKSKKLDVLDKIMSEMEEESPTTVHMEETTQSLKVASQYDTNENERVELEDDYIRVVFDQIGDSIRVHLSTKTEQYSKDLIIDHRNQTDELVQKSEPFQREIGSSISEQLLEIVPFEPTFIENNEMIIDFDESSCEEKGQDLPCPTVDIEEHQETNIVQFEKTDDISSPCKKRRIEEPETSTAEPQVAADSQFNFDFQSYFSTPRRSNALYHYLNLSENFSRKTVDNVDLSSEERNEPMTVPKPKFRPPRKVIQPQLSIEEQVEHLAKKTFSKRVHKLEPTMDLHSFEDKPIEYVRSQLTTEERIQIETLGQELFELDQDVRELEDEKRRHENSVKEILRKLQEYNSIKDCAINLFGAIAEMEGTVTSGMYSSNLSRDL